MKLAHRLAPIAVLFAALAFPAVASAQAQKVGSANVQKIFADIKETKDLEAKLKTSGEALNNQNTQLQQRVQQLQASRNQFKPGTETYDRANQELKRAATQGQLDLQIAQQELQSEQKRQTKMIYDKIVGAVSEVAKEKGYTMVVAQIIPPELSEDQMDQMKTEAVIQMLRQQNLLYLDPSVDVTADVITRLDAKYAGGGSAGGGNAAPAPAPAAAPAPAPAPAPAQAPARR